MILYADWSQISSVIVNSRYFDEKRRTLKNVFKRRPTKNRQDSPDHSLQSTGPARKQTGYQHRMYLPF